jgi:hypothetical protein
MADSARLVIPAAASRDWSAERVTTVPWYIWSAVLAVTSTTFGLYWDISWHTGIGRDTFWTPAHMAIQFGAVLTGVSCAYLILHTTFAGNAEQRAASVSIWVSLDKTPRDSEINSLRNFLNPAVCYQLKP